MAKLSLARRLVKRLTPNSVRVFKGANRLQARYVPAGGAPAARLGQRFGNKVLGLRGFRRSRMVKRGAALAGLGGYAGYRHNKRKRMSSTLMS